MAFSFFTPVLLVNNPKIGIAGVGYYMAIMAVIALAALLAIKENKNKNYEA